MRALPTITVAGVELGIQRCQQQLERTYDVALRAKPYIPSRRDQYTADQLNAVRVLMAWDLVEKATGTAVNAAGGFNGLLMTYAKGDRKVSTNLMSLLLFVCQASSEANIENAGYNYLYEVVAGLGREFSEINNLLIVEENTLNRFHSSINALEALQVFTQPVSTESEGDLEEESPPKRTKMQENLQNRIGSALEPYRRTLKQVSDAMAKIPEGARNDLKEFGKVLNEQKDIIASISAAYEADTCDSQVGLRDYVDVYRTYDESLEKLKNVMGSLAKLGEKSFTRKSSLKFLEGTLRPQVEEVRQSARILQKTLQQRKGELKPPQLIYTALPEVMKIEYVKIPPIHGMNHLMPLDLARTSYHPELIIPSDFQAKAPEEDRFKGEGDYYNLCKARAVACWKADIHSSDYTNIKKSEDVRKKIIERILNDEQHFASYTAEIKRREALNPLFLGEKGEEGYRQVSFIEWVDECIKWVKSTMDSTYTVEMPDYCGHDETKKMYYQAIYVFPHLLATLMARGNINQVRQAMSFCGYKLGHAKPYEKIPQIVRLFLSQSSSFNLAEPQRAEIVVVGSRAYLMAASDSSRDFISGEKVEIASSAERISLNDMPQNENPWDQYAKIIKALNEIMTQNTRASRFVAHIMQKRHEADFGQLWNEIIGCLLMEESGSSVQKVARWIASRYEYFIMDDLMATILER